MRFRARTAAAGLGLSTALAGAFPAAVAAAAVPHFVLPRVHAQSVDPETTAAFEFLLGQEIQRAAPDRAVAAPPGAPCADAGCAARRARSAATAWALYCTLTRLGSEHVAALACVDSTGAVLFAHRLTAPRVEDLNDVAVRFARAVVDGKLPAARARRRTNGRREAPVPATNGDRTRAAHGARNGDSDAVEPRRSALTQGPRFGSIHPVAGSYAGVGSMMSFAWVWRHQTPTFAVEAVPVIGLAWGGSLREHGGEARDWSILDLFVTWTPLPGDVSPVVGAGIGLHGLRLQRETEAGQRTENTLGVALSAGGGVVLFRTYDFQVALDARYQVFLDRFSELDGKGAHGFTFGFGMQRR